MAWCESSSRPGYSGTGDKIAAFQIADNVHTLLFDLVISGMLQAALIPVLIQWAAPGAMNRAELRRVSGALFTLVIAFVGGAVSLGYLCTGGCAGDDFAR